MQTTELHRKRTFIHTHCGAWQQILFHRPSQHSVFSYFNITVYFPFFAFIFLM